MMIDHHTKFGLKKFIGSEDIGKKNIHNFTVTLILNTAIQFTHKFMMKYQQSKFCCKRINSSEDSWNSHILII